MPANHVQKVHGGGDRDTVSLATVDGRNEPSQVRRQTGMGVLLEVFFDDAVSM